MRNCHTVLHSSCSISHYFVSSFFEHCAWDSSMLLPIIRLCLFSLLCSTPLDEKSCHYSTIDFEVVSRFELFKRVLLSTFFCVSGVKENMCMSGKSFQSCSTLCHPMDCSLPDSSVYETLQARILEWVAMPSSKKKKKYVYTFLPG